MKKCQEEFYNPESTTVQFPFQMDEDEKEIRLRDIKLGNIRLIADFYINNQIHIKIISECVEFLLKRIDDMNVRILCELMKKISKKLYYDDNILLERIMSFLEDV